MRNARLGWLTAAAAVLAIFGANSARAEDTIKIGILHRFSNLYFFAKE